MPKELALPSLYLAGEEESGGGLVVGEERVSAHRHLRPKRHPGRRVPRSGRQRHPRGRRSGNPGSGPRERSRRGGPEDGERGGHRGARNEADAARREALERQA